MSTSKKLLVLAGDGIGPEVMGEVKRVIDWMAHRRGVSFDITESLVGGAAIDATGMPCPDATLAAARTADAVLFGTRASRLPAASRRLVSPLRVRMPGFAPVAWTPTAADRSRDGV